MHAGSNICKSLHKTQKPILSFLDKASPFYIASFLLNGTSWFAKLVEDQDLVALIVLEYLPNRNGSMVTSEQC